MGFFDERFLRGGYEDFDFMLRLGMNQIPIYMTEDVKYIRGDSRWNKQLSRLIWEAKWNFPPQIGKEIPTVTKQMIEESYPYDLSNVKDLPLLRHESSSFVNITWFYQHLYEMGLSDKIVVDNKF